MKTTILAYYRFPAEETNPRPFRMGFTPQLAGATVDSWNGYHRGIITSARVYRHNMGGRMVTITAKLADGIYYGRASWDNGNSIRLRKAGDDEV